MIHIIILPSSPRSINWSISFAVSDQNCVTSPLPCMLHPMRALWFHHLNNIWGGAYVMTAFIKAFFSSLLRFECSRHWVLKHPYNSYTLRERMGRRIWNTMTTPNLICSYFIGEHNVENWYYYPNILSRVYGSVINNNGFWIGWLELLTPSLQSLVITIN
jgi:hypothetical protein